LHGSRELLPAVLPGRDGSPKRRGGSGVEFSPEMGLTSRCPGNAWGSEFRELALSECEPTFFVSWVVRAW
ncbi:hypothetical protein Dimus_020997, partial [Dionaea muscipula]